MTIFPRNGTPKDKFGFPHYEAIKKINLKYETNYRQTLKERALEREKTLSKLKGTAREAFILKQKNRIAQLFSMTIKNKTDIKNKDLSIKVLFKTNINENTNNIRKTIFGVYHKGQRVGQFQEFRLVSTKKSLTPILCLPNTGPGFTGIQSSTDLLNEYGHDLALAGFSVILPELTSLEGISPTTNKKWIINGSNSFTEALKTLGFIFAGVQQVPGIESLPINIKGKGFGAILGIFLSIIDSRINHIILDNPTYIDPTNTHESLLIPKFNQVTDMNYLFSLMPDKNILINELNPLFDKNKVNQHKTISLTSSKDFSKKSINWMTKQKAIKVKKPYYFSFQQKPERLFDISKVTSKSSWTKTRKDLEKKYRELLNIPNKPKAISSTLISECVFNDHIRYEFHVQTSQNTMANMTIHKPINAKEKTPVVLSLPGSSSDVGLNYTRYAHEIVAKGWICVTIDARVAIYDFHPHIMEKTSLIAQGIYDILCCTDLIFKRKDVDTKRVACMGISQGGTHSWMLAALDQRIIASVPVCGTCTFKSVCEEQVTEYYGGSGNSFLDSHSIYYYIPDMMCYADQQDLCALIAPRSLAIIGGTRDNCFPLNGMREASKDLKHLYKTVGASENFKYIEFDGPHSIPPIARKKAYQFINNAFNLVSK